MMSLKAGFTFMRVYYVCLSLTASLPVAVQSVQNYWETFLKVPTSENSQRLANKLEQCKSEACAPEVTPTSAEVLRLVKLVRAGHRYAIHLAFLCRGYLDGGDLEDLSRSLGAVTDSAPRVFLMEATERQLTPQQLQSILRMLPESTVDDVGKKQAAIKRRIRSLQKVKDLAFRDVRDESIRVLQHALQE